MCKATTPDYEETATLAREQAPDNAALYEEAMNRAALRGGATRSTSLSGLSGTTSAPTLGKAAQQKSTTVLG